ncbi:rhomboid family intramembrane serine protease [Roseovarius aestuariivivens]|uniref:rhomboid family intramembrane serine protease n=1 Tax=Roseovarius aestuariivivens TaxID=1888910 RepID=UPI001FD91405|nr:rhomboid family intramembrane serine protease [Roseovarius aestuariivivens]
MPWPLALLVLASVLPELALQGADMGLWGSARWRPFAYEHFAFWSGLLGGWIPNYAAQPWLMFLSYAFLHAGFGHLLVNMITLVSVGRAEIDRVGVWRFVIIYIASALGGAVGFELLTSKLQPMVGASGALFGLVGAWVVWDICDVMRERPALSTLAWAILWPVVLLSGLNLLMYWAASGNLAWETHLGGCLAGALLAPFMMRKPPASQV